DCQLGEPPPAGAGLLHRPAVADGVAGAGRADYDAGVQPAWRRPPRRVRPEGHPLARTLSVLDEDLRSPASRIQFAVNEELTKLPPPRHSLPRMRSAPESPVP